MRITVLGSASCIPEAGNDSAHYLINDSILIDTGWNAANNLRQAGCDGQNLHTVLITHTHHDHVLGLPGFLFDYLNRFNTLSTLTIYGPEETPETVARALDTLQLDRFYPNISRPQVIVLHSGEEFDVGGLHICTLWAQHPVPALSYRIQDDHSAAGFTGDTTFHEAQPAFFDGADLVISECSLGRQGDDETKRIYGHSDLDDVKALAAGAKKVALVHLGDHNRAILKSEIDCPVKGKVYEL